MSLKSRIKKLEEANKTEEYIIYEVWSDEDAVIKKQQAWEKYAMKGGLVDHVKTIIQINKLTK